MEQFMCARCLQGLQNPWESLFPGPWTPQGVLVPRLHSQSQTWEVRGADTAEGLEPASQHRPEGQEKAQEEAFLVASVFQREN